MGDPRPVCHAAWNLARDVHAVRDYVATAAGLHGAAGHSSGQGGGLGISGRGCVSDWEWVVGSEDLRGQVEVSEVVGDGVEGPCLRGIGKVPRSKWEWGKAGVRPS